MVRMGVVAPNFSQRRLRGGERDRCPKKLNGPIKCSRSQPNFYYNSLDIDKDFYKVNKRNAKEII